MHVSELWVYPIKSCRGISLPQAAVEPTGLERDRQWMIVEPDGKFITQRKFPQLTQIVVSWDETSLILAQASGEYPPCRVPLNLAGPEMAVQVWRSHTTALDQGDTVATWLTNFLDHPVRLVRQSPAHVRPVNPTYAGGDDVPVSFADGYPVLVTNTASLADLNARLGQTYGDGDRAPTLPMNRFRPNIVLEHDVAFAEDTWSRLQIGTVQLDLVKPCDRCVVTTTDQISGQRDRTQEPLKTLATFRNIPKQGIMFGENAIPRQLGAIAVGDTVSVVG